MLRTGFRFHAEVQGAHEEAVLHIQGAAEHAQVQTERVEEHCEGERLAITRPLCLFQLCQKYRGIVLFSNGSVRRATYIIAYVYPRRLRPARPNASPQAICANVKALVLLLLRDVAPVVLVAKVLPRCFALTDAEASRRLLNRKLTAARTRLAWVPTRMRYWCK
ncbi:hypothetical protein V5799_003236 [Amblyomma americanum]|uniref:Uncharacterized protein n=1 Tax=Amblyomma americanum TaxID=6943 RepID=A0AAQ4D9J8_AMBAM